ncbi:MAG: tetratricopeptide repeat protein [Chitinivibrionia bacterium]|nr:tetratricopeptide repeat protein [Chitinivibrionia bacterium]
MGKLVISQDYMKDVLGVQPNSLLFARYAYNLIVAKKYDEAFEIAKDGVGKHPNYATGRFILALCLIEQGSYTLATEQLVAILKFEPGHQAATEKLAHIYEQTGDTDKAHTVADLLLRRNPKSSLLKKLTTRNEGAFNIREILGEEINWEQFASKADASAGDVPEETNEEDLAEIFGEEDDANKTETVEIVEAVETTQTEAEAEPEPDIKQLFRDELLAGKEAEIDDILADIGAPFTELEISPEEPQSEKTEEKPKEVAQEPTAEKTPEEEPTFDKIEDMFLSKEEANVPLPSEEETVEEKQEEQTENEEIIPEIVSETEETPQTEAENAPKEIDDPFAGLEEPQAEEEEIVEEEEFLTEKPKPEIEDTIEAEVEEAILQGQYIDEEEETETQDISETPFIKDVAADLLETITDIEEKLDETNIEQSFEEEPFVLDTADLNEMIAEEAAQEEAVKEIIDTSEEQDSFFIDTTDFDEFISEIKDAEEKTEEIQDDFIAEIEEAEDVEKLFTDKEDAELEAIMGDDAPIEEPIIDDIEIIEPIISEEENETKIEEEAKPSRFDEAEPLIFDSAFLEDDFIDDENLIIEEKTGASEVAEEGFEEILSEKFDNSFEDYKKELATDIPEVVVEPLAEEPTDEELPFFIEDIADPVAEEPIAEKTEAPLIFDADEHLLEEEEENAPMPPLHKEAEHPQILENAEQKFNEEEEKAEPISEKEAFEKMLVQKEAAQLLPDHILTPTFAQIYLEQGQPYLAKQIYERLLTQSPDNDDYAEKLEEINKHINKLEDGEEVIVEKKTFAPRRVPNPAKKPIKSLKGKRIKPEIRESLKEEFKKENHSDDEI